MINQAGTEPPSISGGEESVPPPSSATGRAVVKFLILLVFLGAALAAYRFTPLRGMVSREEITQLLMSLRQWWWLPAPFMLVLTLGTLLLIPATLFIVPGGAVFGPWWGTLWSMAGGLLAVTCAYAIGRWLGLDLINRLLAQRTQSWRMRLATGGFWTVLTLRLMLLPFILFSYACGAAGVPFLQYLAASALGMLPSFLVLAVFGDAFMQGASGSWRGWAVLAISSAAIFGLSIVGRFMRKRFGVAAEQQPEQAQL